MADPLERRVNLLALLLETSEPLTLERIADELTGQYPDGEAARRGAFERDKAELRDLGVPIEQVVLAGAQSGRTGYWIDRDQYELPDLALTGDERRALQLAVAAVRVGGDAGGLALLKLGAGQDDDGEAAPLVAALPSLAALPVLYDANGRRATVRFRYRGQDRALDPYGLLTRDGFWYVVGREHQSDQRKTFRVDRIEGDLEVGAGGAFTVPEGFDIARAVSEDPKQLGAGEPEVALVAVDALRAASVVRDVGPDAVAESRPDGSVVVRVPCTNRPAFRSWVIGLLDHGEVLGPPDVRDDLIAWLAAMAAPAAPAAPADDGRR